MSHNDLLIYINHLENLHEYWKSRSLIYKVVTDYVISQFECAIELTDLEPSLCEQLFELRMDLEA